MRTSLKQNKIKIQQTRMKTHKNIENWKKKPGHRIKQSQVTWGSELVSGECFW